MYSFDFIVRKLLMQIIFFFLLIRLTISKNRYCNLNCDGYKHTNCLQEPCQPTKNCGSNFAMLQYDNSERQIILHKINSLRSLIAKGSASKNITVADMITMSYSLELEFTAQCWANTCNVAGLHDVCRRTEEFINVFQYIHLITTTYPWEITSDSTTTLPIETWFDKNRQESRDSIFCSKTRYVGCGRTMFGDGRNDFKVIVVCNFAPGCAVGDEVFYEGVPCTRCPGKDNCNVVYRELCGEARAFEDDEFEPPFQIGCAICVCGDFFGVIVFVIVLNGIDV